MPKMKEIVCHGPRNYRWNEALEASARLETVKLPLEPGPSKD
jgi:hypothetical protein